MTRGRRGVSIFIQRDGALRSTSLRLPLWAVRAGLIVGVVLVLLLALGFAFYGPVARQALRVPGLVREVERLTADNVRVRELALALDSVEASYRRLRGMVGADIVPDPVAIGSPVPVAPAIVVVAPGLQRVFPPGPTIPRFWPLDERGFVTRGYAGGATSDEQHPGVDVALATGALVRAAGGGAVVQTGEEPEYGRFVLLAHRDGYQTLYGHLSRVTVREGTVVDAGTVIGRSGNTGRSSAPHLHFEIRHHGVSVDPLTLVKEGS